MAKQKPFKTSDYIVPLNMNGLRGRMLRIPPAGNKKREILIVYGHHSSLERMFGLAEDLHRYGGVTMPDLPGFGGMESFYKLGEKPTLDNLADYLASFVKLFYKRRRVSILATSFGFLVTTRMLQKNPDLVKKVDLLVSIVGFAHKDDFKFTKKNYSLLRYGSSFFSNRVPAWIGKHLVLTAPVIRATYTSMADTHSKLQDADKEERKRRIDFEVYLWQCNDLRTYMDTSVTMLTADVCNSQVELDVYHISVDNDRYFDNHLVEQHLSVIYKKVTIVPSTMTAHAPTVVADAKAAAPLIPPQIRRILSRA